MQSSIEIAERSLRFASSMLPLGKSCSASTRSEFVSANSSTEEYPSITAEYCKYFFVALARGTFTISITANEEHMVTVPEKAASAINKRSFMFDAPLSNISDKSAITTPAMRI